MIVDLTKVIAEVSDKMDKKIFGRHRVTENFERISSCEVIGSEF